MLDDGIYMLPYFHKDSATTCNEKIKKDCDNWKRVQKKKKNIYVSNKMNSVVM